MSDGTQEPGTPKARPEREVRALPVIALAATVLTVAGVVLIGRMPKREAAPTSMQRRGDEPTPIRDEDHYVQGSPPAVSERFLRAWMRAKYDLARDLSTGAMRTHAEREIADVGSFTPEQLEEYRRTRVYVDATHYDLEHVTITDLPPSPEGRARKQVRGQAHAFGSFNGTQIDSRRGQTFVLELVDGAWRVAERTWETFDPQQGPADPSGAVEPAGQQPPAQQPSSAASPPR